MKLGVNDTKARDYKFTERILNICINNANMVRFFFKFCKIRFFFISFRRISMKLDVNDLWAKLQLGFLNICINYDGISCAN